MSPEPTPTPAAVVPPAPAAELGALARQHESALAAIERMPCHLEYITPQEILVLLRYCFDYEVDFTQGLEPKGARGEHTSTYRIPGPKQVNGESFMERPCRIRHELLLADPAGVWIPDGNIAWAQCVLGMLRHAIRHKLEVTVARR